MRYEYKGFGGCDCVCDIQIYGDLIITTELPENNGTSIVNACEDLATKVCNEKKIDYNDLIWIEHHGPDTSYLKNDDYSKVKFEVINGRLHNPRWGKIEKEEVDKLIEENKNKKKKGFFR